MKKRAEWTAKEWGIYLLCMAGSVTAFVLAFQAGSRGNPGLTLVLLGAAASLQGMSWNPELLMSPRLPLPGLAGEEVVETRRFGVTMLTHGAYMFFFGLLIMAVFR